MNNSSSNKFEEDIINILSNYGLALNYLKNPPTFEMCLAAVKNNGVALQFIKQTYPYELLVELYTAAVNQNPWAIKFITNSIDIYHKLCLIALKKSALVIKVIIEPTDDMVHLALETDPELLQYITNQKEEWCLKAVSKCGNVLRHVINQTEAIVKAAVNQNGLALQYVKNATIDIVNLAISRNPWAIKYGIDIIKNSQK